MATELYDSFYDLGLDSLPDEWVDDMWDDSRFSTFIDFPEEYQSYIEHDHVVDLMESLYRKLIDWLKSMGMTLADAVHDYCMTNRSVQPPYSWDTITTEGVEAKKVIAVLGGLVTRYMDNQRSSNYFQEAVLAARLYLFLTALPGSDHLLLFHPTLYSNVINIVHKSTEIAIGKTNKSDHSKSKNLKRSRGTKRAHGQNYRPVAVSFVDDDNDKENSVLGDGVPQEQLMSHDELMTNMDILLDLIQNLLQNKRVSISQLSYLATVSALLEVAKLERTRKILLNDVRFNCATSEVELSYKAFEVLLTMASMLDEDVEKSCAILLREIQIMYIDSKWSVNGMDMAEGDIVRSHGIEFLSWLVVKVGPPCYAPIAHLIQRMLRSGSDKVDNRHALVSCVLDLAKVSPPLLFAGLLRSAVYCANMDDVKCRAAALELICRLLKDYQSLFYVLDDVDVPYKKIVTPQFLISMIIFRCKDSCNSVAADAISHFQRLVECTARDTLVKRLLDTMTMETSDESPSMTEPSSDVADTDQVDADNLPPEREVERDKDCSMEIEYSDESPDAASADPGSKELAAAVKRVISLTDPHYVLFNEIYKDPNVEFRLPTITYITEFLKCLMMEDRNASMRKHTLQLLATLMSLDQKWVNEELLKLMMHGCSNSGVLVRKTLAKQVSSLLIQYPENIEIARCWVSGVLPLINSEEVTFQDTIAEHSYAIIYRNIYGRLQSGSAHSRLLWRILKLIVDSENIPFLNIAVSKWSQKKLIKDPDVKALFTHLNTENERFAWILLRTFSQFTTLPESDRIYEHYKKIRENKYSLPESRIVMEILYFSCAYFEKEIKDSILADLEKDLMDCQLPISIISSARDICEAIMYPPGAPKTDEKVPQEYIAWCSPKIKLCEDYIKMQLHSKKPAISKRDSDMVKFIKTVYTLGELTQGIPHAVDKAVIQYLRFASIKIKNHADREKFIAVVITTLSKLGVQKENEVFEILSTFKKLITTCNNGPNVKLNASLGMCDLFTRNALFLNQFIHEVCHFLAAPEVELRKQTLRALLRRMREEYIKVRPFVLYPVMRMVNDADNEVRLMVRSYITYCNSNANFAFKNYYPGLFFFLNGSDKHSNTVDMPIFLMEDFAEPVNTEVRQEILLNVLNVAVSTAKDRLIISERIVLSIITPITDGAIPFELKTDQILEDVFTILIHNEKRLKEMIRFGRKADSESAPDEQAAETGKKAGESVTDDVRFNKFSSNVNLFLKLRKLFTENCCQSSKLLYQYLYECVKNHKNEINFLFSEDDMLVTELQRLCNKTERVKPTAVQEELDSASEDAVESRSPHSSIVSNNSAFAAPSEKVLQPKNTNGPNRRRGG